MTPAKRSSATTREIDPELRQINVGRQLLRAFETFEARIVGGLRERGFMDFRMSDSAALRNLDLTGTRITELAQRARMTKQGMSLLVEDLQRRGYVERRPDPCDGRAKLVFFTKRGRDLIREGQAVNHELDEEWRSVLGKDGFATLRKLLEKIPQTE